MKTTPAHVATLAGLLQAAHKITAELAENFREDLAALNDGSPDGVAIAQAGDFTVGSLLTVEKAAADLLALLAAAKTLRDLSKSGPAVRS